MTDSDYDDYCKWFDQYVLPMYPKAKRPTKEEFKLDAYRDDVYEYVQNEWTGVGLHEIFYKDVDFEFDENSELSPEEERGYLMQDGVDGIIKECYSRGESVANSAALAYDFLRNQGVD